MYECLKVAGATIAAVLHRLSDFGRTAGAAGGAKRAGKRKRLREICHRSKTNRQSFMLIYENTLEPPPNPPSFVESRAGRKPYKHRETF